ncbi:C40 family peptidase [Thermaurantiacus sp.]
MNAPGQPRIRGPRATAPLSPLDPRINAWRPGLADVALAGRVSVSHYAAPVLRMVTATTAPLHAAPDPASALVSELFHGEVFAVLEDERGWAWGQAADDSYVGYVPTAALGPVARADAGTKEARVGPGDALVFLAPALKAPSLVTLPALSRLIVGEASSDFLEVAAGPHTGRFVHRRHLIGPEPASDAVAHALRFLGSPYRWGGRTRSGIDCSGLVQVALRLAGQPARRDSDMLFADAGPDVRPAERARGDIVWWPGHIGLLVDSQTLLHANAFWMTVVAEPLADVEARIGAAPQCRRPRPAIA